MIVFEDRRFILLAKQILIGLSICCATSAIADTVHRLQYKVLGSLPHQEQSFTQGLEYIDTERLIESTGLYGKSTLQVNDLRSGRTIHKHSLPHHLFGEGVTVIGDSIYQLTWKANKVLVYHVDTLKLIKTLEYKGEGWGLTHDKEHLIMSNGSADLVFRRIEDFTEVRRIVVKQNGVPLLHLNELEWIDGFIFANIWGTSDIVVIDPTDGRVVGLIDIVSLNNDKTKYANGIAWDVSNHHLLVTGKNWKQIFVLKLKNFPFSN